MDSKPSVSPPGSRHAGFALTGLVLLVVLAVMFHGVFAPGRILFSNDGPLGRLVSDSHRLPDRFTGCWQDLNALGYREEAATASLSFGLQWLLKPVAFSKFYAPLALLLLGLAAWYFFRVSGLAPPACLLGGLAVVLNSSFFSVAAWGVAAHDIAIAMTFLALAALSDTTSRRRWLRVALAGLAVGMGVTEGADLGAIFSVLVAAFVIYQAWITPGPRTRNLATGIGRVSLVAVCAALLAAQAFSELVNNDILEVSAPQQEIQNPQIRWDWATQWSLPKRETLGFVVPGLFGYRVGSADGGAYWGSTGRDPAWDRYVESGGQGPAPTGFVRYVGGGYYAGVMVLLVAVWAGIQALRRKELGFSPHQRKLLWFWLGVGLVSLLLGFGRFAPFYRLVYALPYFSTIRNPIKYLDVLSFALVIVFAFGVDGLWRKYLQPAGGNGGQPRAGLKAWWSKAGRSEKRWLQGCLFVLAATLAAWLVYAANRDPLAHYLERVQFDSAQAHAIADFSVRQVGWFVLFFVLGGGLMALMFSGVLAGRRAVWGAGLLGLVLALDLGRANLEWILYWNYHEKYLSNPVVDVLRNQPWEHRVAILEGNAHSRLTLLDRLYKVVWEQDQFAYYNVQTEEVAQMARMPKDISAFVSELFPPGQTTKASSGIRFWQLTSARYIMGNADSANYLNHQLDPVKQRFRIVERFKVVPKPGLAAIANIYDATVVPDPNGEIALFEFTGALPRAKLYSTWQTATNNEAALEQVVGESFDPEQSVLVTGGPPVQEPAPGTNQNAGEVEFASYSPKDIVLKSDAPSATVLLLNDRYDPSWKVLVDGSPGTVLRCNYLMRGVALTPGAHTVEFQFRPPTGPLHVSLATLGFGVLVLGVTAVVGNGWQSDAPAPLAPAGTPPPEPTQPAVNAPSAPRPKRKRRK